MHAPKSLLYKHGMCPTGVCHTPNCISPLWAACKVVLSGMQILENYARCQYFLLHNTNSSGCQCCTLHATCPKSIFYEIT